MMMWLKMDVIRGLAIIKIFFAKTVELCKSAVDICNCKDADKDIDCHWCKEGGRADIGRKILQILKTQEVK